MPRDVSPGPSSSVVVLVAGLGRSGTTLLEALLAEHVGGVAVGEVRYLWERGLLRGELCSCGVPVPECEFWTSVLARAYGERDGSEAAEIASLQYDINRNRRLLSLLVPWLRRRQLRGQLDQFVHVMVPLYESIAEVSRREVVIDSSKHPAFGLALLAAPAVRLVVVHLVRDSRGAAHSWQRRQRRPEVHWQEEYMDQLPAVHTALTWNLQNFALDVLGRRSRWYARVRYEDFVADPQTTLDMIARMCADAGATVQSESSAGPLAHSVAGNPLRFDRRPLQITPDIAWREQMPLWQRLAVTTITAPMLLRYGYSLRIRGARSSVRGRRPR